MLTAQLYQIARVTHVVNGVRRPDADAPAARRAPARAIEADRRTGFDRRHRNLGRADGDRRDGAIGGSARAGCAIAPARSIWSAPRAAPASTPTRRSRISRSAPRSRPADGTVITGCNIENATYGLTICAERVAMFKALSEGHRAFTRIAIVADTEAPTPPCGACRQILWEFGGNLEIQLANLTEEKGTHRLKDLLPLPFDARLL